MTTEPQSLPDSASLEAHRDAVEQLCEAAFGADAVSVGRLVDVNRGRGAFSVVIRASLEADSVPVPVPFPKTVPKTVVAKLPIQGPNGAAAVAGGAYAREALAYRTIVNDSPIRTPRVFAVETPDDGTCSILLEDLSGFRAADQLVGLGRHDASAVAGTLSRLHKSWADNPRLTNLAVRRNTVVGISPGGLEAGLETLTSTWGAQLSDAERSTFRRLVGARSRLVELFCAQKPTLCHGDPRADNLVFDGEQVVLFDWQQLAVQFGEADLAWLAATSLKTEKRRAMDRDLVSAYGGDLDRYRLGFALPGMAVLMLAQRSFSTDRARRFVSVSLRRIAAALEDLEVPALS